MIVYPTYIYMGKKEPAAPDFPFWENGVLNASMDGSIRSVFYPAENRVQVQGGKAIFTVDSTKYSKIKFNANAFTTISVLVYATENGKVYGSERYFVESTKKDFEFIIPEAFRKSGAKFGFDSGEATLYLNSIIMTN